MENKHKLLRTVSNLSAKFDSFNRSKLKTCLRRSSMMTSNFENVVSPFKDTPTTPLLNNAPLISELKITYLL